MGVLSMMSSDSQAMGRVGEVTTRNWQTADKMKKMAGSLPEDNSRNDNFRVKRYLAKITINPAITHGISDYVGTIQPGRFTNIMIAVHTPIRAYMYFRYFGSLVLMILF